MQLATTDGLVSAPKAARRFAVKCIHDAPVGLAASLIEEWSTCTALVAHAKLSQPDVLVTNQSDKELQLPKVLELDRKVRSVSGLMTQSDYEGEASAKMEDDWQQRALRAEARVAELEKLLAAAAPFSIEHGSTNAINDGAQLGRSRGGRAASTKSSMLATKIGSMIQIGSRRWQTGVRGRRRVRFGVFTAKVVRNSSAGPTGPGSSQSGPGYGEVAASMSQGRGDSADHAKLEESLCTLLISVKLKPKALDTALSKALEWCQANGHGDLDSIRELSHEGQLVEAMGIKKAKAELFKKRLSLRAPVAAVPPLELGLGRQLSGRL